MAHTALRRLGIVAAIFVLAVVAVGITGVAYVAHNIRVTDSSRLGHHDVSIRTPAGDFSIRENRDLDPVLLGMPIYPNAKRAKNNSGGASFEWNSADGKDNKALSVAGGDYVTADSASDVLAWYKSHLPNWVLATDIHDQVARFELNDGGYKRIIAVREKGDGTHIGVATIGEPASN